MDVREANALVDILGRQTKRELSNRGKLETILFPNSSYENLSAIEMFYRYPAIVAQICARVSPEALVERCPKLGGAVIPMQYWTVGFEYLWGRQLLLGLGRLTPGDHRDEGFAVLDFWRRLNLAYRGDGKVCAGEGGRVNRVLPRELVTRLVDDTEFLEEAARTRFLRLHAQLLSFLILMNCESRARYGVTGPYVVGNDTMIVTEFADLDGRGYPWALDSTLPARHVTMAIVVRDAKIRLANAGLAYGQPPNFLEHVVRVRLYAADAGVLRPLAMTEWDGLRDALAKAQRDLYRRFATMSLRERILAGTWVYFTFLRPLADAAGLAGAIDWNLCVAPDYYPFFEDAREADRLFDECLLKPADTDSSYTRYPD